ncbi:MAG TPA: hypothetical protein VJQ56_16360 [Blastocatellia bacterium]|nr:hypothetical protein [Blastocatellia bacterium]
MSTRFEDEEVWEGFDALWRRVGQLSRRVTELEAKLTSLERPASKSGAIVSEISIESKSDLKGAI